MESNFVIPALISEKRSINQDLVLQHMSNHYKRILNAKKVIDTSPPRSYKFKNCSNENFFPASAAERKNCSTLQLNNRNISPVLTERSISSNSYKDSCFGTESHIGSSRYHLKCFQPSSYNSDSKQKYVCFDKALIDRIAFDTKYGPSEYW